MPQPQADEIAGGPVRARRIERTIDRGGAKTPGHGCQRQAAPGAAEQRLLDGGGFRQPCLDDGRRLRGEIKDDCKRPAGCGRFADVKQMDVRPERRDDQIGFAASFLDDRADAVSDLQIQACAGLVCQRELAPRQSIGRGQEIGVRRETLGEFANRDPGLAVGSAFLRFNGHGDVLARVLVRGVGVPDNPPFG